VRAEDGRIIHRYTKPACPAAARQTKRRRGEGVVVVVKFEPIGRPVMHASYSPFGERQKRWTDGAEGRKAEVGRDAGEKRRNDRYGEERRAHLARR